MAMWVSVAMLIGGLAILALAADRFVVAAARLSRRWGVSPVLVGALVVGMGTSAPELLVSALAGVDGELDLAVLPLREQLVEAGEDRFLPGADLGLEIRSCRTLIRGIGSSHFYSPLSLVT